LIKKTFDSRYIHNYKAVYLDKETHEWIPYEKSYISLQDTSMVFETNHLTFIAVSFYIWASGYDRGYERNNISVYYKDKETGFMESIYDKKQTPQPWHKAWPPLLVQDVTEYLNEVREKFLLLGFSIPEKFNVYIKQMDDADGIVGISGMINDYLTIHTFTENPIALRSLLAHEYMHYTQSGFISPDPGNIFWMEANAHLTDRMVWDENEIPVSESEKYLLDGRKAENSIYDFLSNSWDHWDKGIYTQKSVWQCKLLLPGRNFSSLYAQLFQGRNKIRSSISFKTNYSNEWRYVANLFKQLRCIFNEFKYRG